MDFEDTTLDVEESGEDEFDNVSLEDIFDDEADEESEPDDLADEEESSEIETEIPVKPEEAESKAPSRQAQQTKQETPETQPEKAGEVEWEFGGKKRRATPQQLENWARNGINQADYTRRVQDLLNWYQNVRDKVLSVELLSEYLDHFPEKREAVNAIIFGGQVQQQAPPTNSQPSNVDSTQLLQPQNPQVADPMVSQAQRDAEQQYMQNWYRLKMAEQHQEDMALQQQFMQLEYKMNTRFSPEQKNQICQYMVNYNIDNPEFALKLWQNDYLMKQAQSRQSAPQSRPAPAPVAKSPAPAVLSGNRASTRGVNAISNKSVKNTKVKDLNHALRLSLRDLERG